MQESWQDSLRRGVQHRDGHYTVDVTYLEDQILGHGAKRTLDWLGDVRDLRWRGPSYVQACLRRLDTFARRAPDVVVVSGSNVPPTGEEFVMPSGKTGTSFGTTFGQDGITGTPWQQWVGAAKPPGVVVGPAESRARRVIVWPEFGVWERAASWTRELLLFRETTSARRMFKPTLSQRFWVKVWPKKVIRECLQAEQEAREATERMVQASARASRAVPDPTSRIAADLRDPEPGEPICETDCPCCNAHLQIVHGADPGEIVCAGPVADDLTDSGE